MSDNNNIIASNNEQMPPMFNVTIKRTDCPAEYKYENVLVSVNMGTIIIQNIEKGTIAIFSATNHTLEGQRVQ